MSPRSNGVIKAAGFLAWNLNAAQDRREVTRELTVEAVTQAIEQGRFVELLNEHDPSRPAEILDPQDRAKLNDKVRELFEVRRFKYAGASSMPLSVCLGFLLAVINNEISSAAED